MRDLSMDARVIISSHFRYGEKTQMVIGGKFAQAVLSDRAAAAMKELVDGGYVLAELFNGTGRMKYTGTDKCHDKTLWLSMKDIEQNGAWSLTKPNPEPPNA